MSDAWRTTPILVGRHVTLRPLVPEDKEALVAVAATDDLWDVFYASVSQLKDADRWFAATFAQVEQGQAGVAGDPRDAFVEPAEPPLLVGRRGQIGDQDGEHRNLADQVLVAPPEEVSGLLHSRPSNPM